MFPLQKLIRCESRLGLSKVMITDSKSSVFYDAGIPTVTVGPFSGQYMLYCALLGAGLFDDTTITLIIDGHRFTYRVETFDQWYDRCGEEMELSASEQGCLDEDPDFDVLEWAEKKYYRKGWDFLSPELLISQEAV